MTLNGPHGYCSDWTLNLAPLSHLSFAYWTLGATTGHLAAQYGNGHHINYANERLRPRACVDIVFFLKNASYLQSLLVWARQVGQFGQ